MRHLAAAGAAVVACPPSAKAEGLGLAARIKVPAARRKGREAPRTAVQADRVGQAVQVTSGVPVGPATTADRAVQVGPVDLAVQVTSAARVGPATTADPADRVVPETSAGPVVPATSGRDRPMRSEASTVSHGAMEQRRGAGEHLRAPDGAGRSLPRAECGTKGRSTTGASKNNRSGIGTKTVGASGSSESGSRCNEPAG